MSIKKKSHIADLIAGSGLLGGGIRREAGADLPPEVVQEHQPLRGVGRPSSAHVFPQLQDLDRRRQDKRSQLEGWMRKLNAVSTRVSDSGSAGGLPSARSSIDGEEDWQQMGGRLEAAITQAEAVARNADISRRKAESAMQKSAKQAALLQTQLDQQLKLASLAESRHQQELAALQQSLAQQEKAAQAAAAASAHEAEKAVAQLKDSAKEQQRSLQSLVNSLRERDAAIAQLQQQLARQPLANSSAMLNASTTPLSATNIAAKPSAALLNSLKMQSLELAGQLVQPAEQVKMPLGELSVPWLHAKLTELEKAQAVALRKLERARAEDKARYASCLHQLEGLLAGLERQQQSTLQTTEAAMQSIMERAARIMSGRAAGTSGSSGETAPRRPASAAGRSRPQTPTAAPTSLAVLSEMNEQLAAENAALLLQLSRSASRRHSAAGEAAGEAGNGRTPSRPPSALQGVVAAASRDAALAHKRGQLPAILRPEAWGDDSPDAESGELVESLSLAEQNLELRAAQMQLKGQIGELQGRLQVLEGRLEEALEQVRDGAAARRQLEQDLAYTRTTREELRRQVQDMEASMHSAEAFRAELARAEQAEQAAKAARAEVVRQRNLVLSNKREAEAEKAALRAEMAKVDAELTLVQELLRSKDLVIERMTSQESQDAGARRLRPPSRMAESAHFADGGAEDVESSGLSVTRRGASFSSSFLDRQDLKRLQLENGAARDEISELRTALKRHQRQAQAQQAQQHSMVRALRAELRQASEAGEQQARNHEHALEAATAALAACQAECGELQGTCRSLEGQLERAHADAQYLRMRLKMPRTQPNLSVVNVLDLSCS
ncbi:hypothetical protein WJX72_002228 [[Myrmecia] bisecta]|uniref:Uncharacterized protein n=1 Tax=[Myrmecia] bisecta TaxID=41462 RepID=A0AAW1P4A5_9CHLO